MSELNTDGSPKWYFWAIGIAGLIWSLIGCYDYLMFMTGNEKHLARMPQDLVDYFNTIPGLIKMAYSFAIWGTLVGWILYLLRSRYAVMAFAAALLGLLMNYGFLVPTGGVSLMGTGGAVFSGFVVVLAVFALWFSGQLKNRGVLT